MTYHLGRLIWGSPIPGLLAASLVAVDFLRLTFSRLALLDIFLATPVLAALVFAWSFRIRRQPGYLLATGLTLGLATAAKWSGAWAVVPIALALMPQERGTEVWRTALRHGAVVLVAAGAGYLLPWLYHVLALGYGQEQLVALHAEMLGYQVQAGATEVLPWENLVAPLFWLFNGPLVITSGADRSPWIVLMSNPLVFWPGVGAMGWLALRAWKAPRSGEVFILAACLCFYLPWFAFPRIKYFYYLLPALPLLAVALGGLLHRFCLVSHPANTPPRRRRRFILAAYLALAAAFFVAAYPSLTGMWTR